MSHFFSLPQVIVVIAASAIVSVRTIDGRTGSTRRWCALLAAVQQERKDSTLSPRWTSYSGLLPPLLQRWWRRRESSLVLLKSAAE